MRFAQKSHETVAPDFDQVAAVTGVAVVNSIGNLAGFVSPYVIVWIIDCTHSTDPGVYTLAACLTIGGLLVLALPKQLVNR